MTNRRAFDVQLDRGLEFDLQRLHQQARRRQFLRWIAATSLLPLVGACAKSAHDAPVGVAGAGGEPGDGCSPIPRETEGPYPGDGSNGPSALTLSGIVRSDIRSSIAGANGVAEGVPLKLSLALLDSKGCAPLSGYAVYAWHCDRAGEYSMYTGSAANENYLRGVQVSDAAGELTFTSIFPACYPGRWPHVHFEIYENLERASEGQNAIRISQLAFPQGVCEAAYAEAGYGQSTSHLAALSLAADPIFSDGVELQLAAVSGDPSAGYHANLSIAV